MQAQPHSNNGHQLIRLTDERLVAMSLVVNRIILNDTFKRKCYARLQLLPHAGVLQYDGFVLLYAAFPEHSLDMYLLYSCNTLHTE